jgi:putative DNA primase/helicase
MFSFLSSSDTRLPIAFLEHFRTSQAAWVLVVRSGSGKLSVATFPPALHGAASAWVAKTQRQKCDVCVLMAETLAPVNGTALLHGHLRGTRHFAVKLPISASAALEVFRPAPFLRLEAGSTIYAAWRLFNEVSLDAAEEAAKTVAEQFGGVVIGEVLPLAGTIHRQSAERIRLVHLYKDRLAVLTDFHKAPARSRAASFVKATEITAKPLSWLWDGAVLRGALSLLAGAGGVGKSTVAASIAATVTAGGMWPDGGRAKVGGVIFCEGEDDPASVTLPRLKAVGADLSRLALGPVCDLSVSVAALDEAADTLGEVSLLVLSPVRSFFGAESYVETTVRERLKLVLEWAARRNVAVLGVSHPPQGKRSIGGAGAWTNAARAGFFVEKAPRDPLRRILTPLKANSGRDGWSLDYHIEGVSLTGGIDTSRVVWLGERSVDQRPTVTTARPADAASWLEAALSNGPRNAAELKGEATASGISTGALYRAAKRLGVTMSERSFGGSKQWTL